MAQFGFDPQGSTSTMRQPGSGEPPAEDRRAAWRGRWREAGPRGSVGEPFIVLVIGIALVLVDQNSSEVSNLLRTPALLGGLVLAAHGINQVKLRWSTPDPTPPTADELARERARADADDDEPPAQPSGGGGFIAYFLLVLAIWLGLAALSLPTAPLSLILLSLLAAILLFSDGLSRLQPGEG